MQNTSTEKKEWLIQWRKDNPSKIKEYNKYWSEIFKERKILNRLEEMKNTGLEYRDVSGYEDMYIMNELGEIRKKSTLFVIKPLVNNYGYFIIKLNKKLVLLHRILALTFIPNDEPDFKQHVTHINMIKTDNSLSNLKWVNRGEHMKELIQSGKVKSNFTNWYKKKHLQN
jgi:hypothetical protein